MATNDLTVKPSLQQVQTVIQQTQGVQVSAKNETVESQPRDKVESVAVSPVEPKEQDSPQVLLEELQEKVAQLNDHMQNLNRSLKFTVDEQSGETVVRVIDAETDKLVRQIPAQEVLDVRNAIEKYRGILLEAKV